METISITAALRCVALRVAIDIETPIVFYRNAQRSTIVHYRSLSQRSAAQP